jgi:hypothetical protein
MARRVAQAGRLGSGEGKSTCCKCSECATTPFFLSGNGGLRSAVCGRAVKTTMNVRETATLP